MLKYFGVIAMALLPWMGFAAEAVNVAAIVPERNVKVVQTSPGVFRMEAKSGANPAGKSAQYCRFILKFTKPVDLRNRTLSFKASSDTPDKIMAFYVRAYGSNLKKPDGSFYSYTPLFQKNPGPIRFSLREKKSAAPLLWEHAAVTGQPAEQITQLQFLVGTRSADSDIRLTVSDLQLSDAPAVRGEAVAFSRIIPERNVKVVQTSPGVFRMEAKSGANPPGRSAQYCRFILEFKEPVDLQNNRLYFNVSSETGDRIVALYARTYGSDMKKPDGSFSKYAALFKGQTAPLRVCISEGNGQVLAWEKAVVTGKPATGITRLQFLVGTRSANSDIQLTVSDFKLVSKHKPHQADAAKAVPEFFKEENLNISGGDVIVKKKISAWQITSPGNGRFFLDVNLPFTVDMTGKQFAFTVKTAEVSDIRDIRVLLFQEGDGRPAWYHVAWGAPLEVTPGGRFVVYENSAGGTLKNDCRLTSGKAAAKVMQFQIQMQITSGEKRPVKVAISDIRIEPQAPTGLKATDNWSPVPVYAENPARVKHPVGPIREEAISRARENIQNHSWARKQAENYRSAGKHWLTLDKEKIPHWIPKEDAFFKCVCPNCRTATEFAWAGVDAISKDGNTLICQKCKMTFPNEKYPENHTYTVENPDGSLKTIRCYLGPDQIAGGENMGPRHHITGALNYVKIRHLAAIRYVALLYTLEPKKEYAERVRDVLLRAAEVYPGYSVKFRSTVYKNPRAGQYMGGKFHSWKFSDSGIISSLMQAYTLTYNSGVYSDADKVAIENGLAREYLWLMTAYPPSADYCSNAVPAHYNAAAFCAAVLGDHDAMQWVLHSLPDFLNIYYRRDGFWHEATPSYANMANGPLNLLAATLNGYSDAADYQGKDRYDNIDITTLLPQLGQVLNCMAVGILPTGTLPAVNDSSYATRQSSMHLDQVAMIRPTESNKRMAAYVARRYPVPWERDTLFTRAADADPQEPRPEILNRSRIVPGGGWVILRRPESAEKSATVLTYPAYSSSHMHQSTLGFFLCEDGKEVSSDLGYQSCWHPEYPWILSPLAHNLVIVDGAGQGTGRYGEVELFAGHTEALAVRVAGYRTAPGASRHARTLLDLPLPGARKYVVDLFEVAGGKRHTYVFHADGPRFSAGDIAFKPGNAERIGGGHLGTRYLQDVRSAELAQGTHRFEWEFDKENITTCHLALAKKGLLITGVGPGTRAQSLEKTPLHVLTMEQAGPENLFASVIESTAPGKAAITKVERLDAADSTTLTVTHRHGRDVITHYRNGDLTVVRYDAAGTCQSVWIAGDREIAGVKGYPEYRGKITHVSEDGRTLTTSLDNLPEGYDLAGKILSIDGLGDGAYRIASAEMINGKAVIKLDPEEIPRDVKAGKMFRFRPVVESPLK